MSFTSLNHHLDDMNHYVYVIPERRKRNTASVAHVVLFYRYFSNPVNDEEALDEMTEWQKSLCSKLLLTGRVLLAKEGINATLSGDKAALDAYQLACESWTVSPLLGGYVRPLRGIDWKRSTSTVDPFPDLVVKRVNQIVSSGNLPYDLDQTGTHLAPEDFHAMITQQGRDDMVTHALVHPPHPCSSVVTLNAVTFSLTMHCRCCSHLLAQILLDVRNRFENSIGHFLDAQGKPALHPNMKNYSGLAEYMSNSKQALEGKTVVMYCTGGVRCETASAHLQSTGVADKVYQLQGGIHRYLGTVNPNLTALYSHC